MRVKHTSILAVVLVFTLVACGSKPPKPPGGGGKKPPGNRQGKNKADRERERQEQLEKDELQRQIDDALALEEGLRNQNIDPNLGVNQLDPNLGLNNPDLVRDANGQLVARDGANNFQPVGDALANQLAQGTDLLPTVPTSLQLNRGISSSQHNGSNSGLTVRRQAQ